MYSYINLLKPTLYVMHHQFYSQQLYALPTLYLYAVYLSESKIKIYRTTSIILPVVLYGCETWSLTLREERRLRVLRIGC